MIARHWPIHGTYYTTNRVIDDFGNELILRLVDQGAATSQCVAIHAFLTGPLH
jgi:hypothetical protein